MIQLYMGLWVNWQLYTNITHVIRLELWLHHTLEIGQFVNARILVWSRATTSSMRYFILEKYTTVECGRQDLNCTLSMYIYTYYTNIIYYNI